MRLLIGLGDIKQPLSPCTSSTPPQQICSKLVLSTLQRLGIPWRHRPSCRGRQRWTAHVSRAPPVRQGRTPHPRPPPSRWCNNGKRLDAIIRLCGELITASISHHHILRASAPPVALVAIVIVIFSPGHVVVVPSQSTPPPCGFISLTSEVAIGDL